MSDNQVVRASQTEADLAVAAFAGGAAEAAKRLEDLVEVGVQRKVDEIRSASENQVDSQPDAYHAMNMQDKINKLIEVWVANDMTVERANYLKGELNYLIKVRNELWTRLNFDRSGDTKSEVRLPRTESPQEAALDKGFDSMPQKEPSPEPEPQAAED